MAISPEEYRGYLHGLARLQIPAQVALKADLSGIVQQTLFEAVRDGAGSFASWENERQKAWLRRLFSNNLRDALKRIGAARRGWKDELSLDATLSGSPPNLANGDSTPSQKVIRAEEFERLVEAMEKLPEPQRDAIQAIHLEGRSLEEIATKTNRTKGAVAALLYRGMKQLREWLKEESSWQRKPE